MKLIGGVGKSLPAGTRTQRAIVLLAPTEQINCWEHLNIPIVIGRLTCQPENPFLMISQTDLNITALLLLGLQLWRLYSSCVWMCFSCVSGLCNCVLASSSLASFSWLAAACLLEWACGQGDGCGDIHTHSSLCPHQKHQQYQPETLCCMWEHRECLQRVLHVLTSCLVYTEVWKLLKYNILYMIFTTDL